MFCSNCGTELPEEETLCPACGEDLTADASLDDLLAEVKESFHLEDPAEETEETPAEETEAEATSEEEETTYAVPVLVEEPEEKKTQKQKKEKKPKKEKKKAGKAVRVLTIIFAVVLVLAAAAGFLYLANETYNKASECLAVKDYEQAEVLFARFPFFKDSGEQADRLVSQQQAYDNAAALVQRKSYNEALKGYAALGDYRDSQLLLTALVPYQQATYLMENAEAGNAAALARLPNADPSSTELVEILLYKGAAELFASLENYQDSADLASACYTRLASVYMTNSRFEEALACHEFLNAADLEESVAEYLKYCEDEALLSDLGSVISERWAAEEANQLTDLELVHMELDRLTYYVEEEGLMFYDTQLLTLLADYISGLETEASSVDEAGNCQDVITWYTGSAARCAVIEKLIETYDLLGFDAALQAEFSNKSAYYQAAIIVEGAVAKQLVGTTAQNGDEGDYLAFENTTGYTFSLSVRNEFFNEAGESVFLHQTEPVPVPKDTAVKIPIIFPEESNWKTWKTAWEYDIEIG